MSEELIYKKLDQMRGLILELEEILPPSFLEFGKRKKDIHAAERDFLLLVELASDINAQIINEAGRSIPDHYWESFRGVERLKAIPYELSKDLIESAKLRNVLIHEYDFDQDNFIFYKSVKKYMATYKHYISAIEKYYDKI